MKDRSAQAYQSCERLLMVQLLYLMRMWLRDH